MRWMVALALVCGCGAELPVGPGEARALHYDYSIDLRTREARAEVSLEMTFPGDCIDIPVRAADLREVTLDGEPASGQLAGGVLTACGRGWDEGDPLTLVAETTVLEETWGDSQVGFSVTEDGEGAPFSYLVSWVGGCDRFAPCQSEPDRFATYRFEVAHDPGTRVLCPGRVTEAGGVTICELDTPAPTYSAFAAMASPSWVEVDLGDWNGLAVTLYDSPAADLASAIDPGEHAAMLAWMEERFGPYPFGDELRLAVGPTYWNGFEHPGNIALSETLAVDDSQYPDPVAHTIHHEIVHMWAGDRTTLASARDFVWKEAMAEYLTFAFLDEEVSPAAARATASAWKLFSRFAEYHPVPEEDPPLLDFYGDVYGPGPMVLFRQIEALFSRQQVLEAIAALLAEPVIGVDDVRLALEEATGADLADYFEAWVYGAGAPTYPQMEVAIAESGEGSYEVTVTQARPAAPLYGGAFAVALTGEGGARHEVEFDLGPSGAASQTVTATPGFEVTGYQFDPRAETLAIGVAAPARAPDRFNPWVSARGR